jgi:hypothetical protein
VPAFACEEDILTLEMTLDRPAGLAGQQASDKF